MNAPDVKEKRKAWVKTIIEYSPEKLVYLDESGVNTDMTRIYGRAMGGAGAVDNAPINTPANTTILSSIRLNGETAYTTYSGGTTGDKLIDYLKNVLIPTLSKGDVIIMDNMRSHHVKAVREAIEDAEMTLLYLPPYSPDLNPIEQMWSIVKAVLRKLKIRVSTELPAAIKFAFSLITKEDCYGWFNSAGALG